MIPHPAAWDAMLADQIGFRPAVRVTAWRPGSGATLDVPVTDGWVLKDAGQFPRTHVQVTCADTSLVPHTASDLLQPNGSCLKVEYGYTDTAGTTTWITVADGPITQITADRPGALMRVEAADPTVGSSSHTDMDAGTGFTYFAGTTIVSAITSLAGAGVASYAGIDTTALTAAQLAQVVPADYTIPKSTRWEQVEELADLLGAEAYFRPDRFLVLRPVPVKGGTPAFAFEVGPAGTITGYQSETRRAVSQVALRYGTGPSWITGVWQDLDPNSPTYTLGPYGTFGVLEVRDGTPTQTEADAAARAYAKRLRGDGRTFTVRAVPVPWLEPGDTVTVSPVGNITETHVCQSVSLPLGLDVMTMTTRDPAYTSAI